MRQKHQLKRNVPKNPHKVAKWLSKLPRSHSYKKKVK